MAAHPMRAPRPVALAGAVLLAGAATGCGAGADDATPTSAYAAEVEAIVEGPVARGSIAASDALTNVLQGGSERAAGARLRRAEAMLRDAEADLAGLEPPASVRPLASELAILVGELADEAAEPVPGGRAATGARVEALHSYDSRIDALAGGLGA